MSFHQMTKEREKIAPLLEHFTEIETILKTNKYIDDTTNKLHRILDDAASTIQILFVGKEGVGKTSVINALLGRELLPATIETPTEVNTFVKYGEEERVEAYFYDGYVTTFSLSKLHLFNSSQNELAETIRNHVNYIVIFIKHNLLKNVTLIDSKPIEILHNQSVYFSHTILNRVDEIFWLLRGTTPTTDDELKLLKKISLQYTKPYILINAIDEAQSVHQFINEERARYGEYVHEFHTISAKQAITSRKTNDTQDFIDSQATNVIQLIEKIAQNEEKKSTHTILQIKNWLERFRKEIENIPTREPYISAIEVLRKHKEEVQLEFSREKRDLAIIQTYAVDYKQTANLFKEVQTLYQLLKVIGSELYLRDDVTERFEELATNYQHQVRSYRTIYSEYESYFATLKKDIKKSEVLHGELSILLNPKADKVQLQDQILLLNDKQLILHKTWNEIKLVESKVLEELSNIQDYIMKLLNNRLQKILQQVSELNHQRQADEHAIVSYNNKLAEFDCIKEAQNYLQDTIKPLLEDNVQEIEPLYKAEMMQTIDLICGIELEHAQLRGNVAENQTIIEPFKVNFVEDYKVFALNLTEQDVVSDIPALPNKIVLA